VAYGLTVQGIQHNTQIIVTPNYVSNPYMYQPSSGFIFQNTVAQWYKVEISGDIAYYNADPDNNIRYVQFYTQTTTGNTIAGLFPGEIGSQPGVFVHSEQTDYCQIQSPIRLIFRAFIGANVYPLIGEYFKVRNLRVKVTREDP
jgi:hypothetical protein